MHQISFGFYSKGHNSRKGDNSDKKKKMCVKYFPWGMHIWNFKTLACTVLDGRTDVRMRWRTDNPKPICPVNFFEVGGITIMFYDDGTNTLEDIYIFVVNIKYFSSSVLKYQHFHKCVARVKLMIFSIHEIKYFWYLPKKKQIFFLFYTFLDNNGKQAASILTSS